MNVIFASFGNYMNNNAHTNDITANIEGKRKNCKPKS